MIEPSGIVSAETFGTPSVAHISVSPSITPGESFGIPEVYALEDTPCITPKLKSIIPDFILEDHPGFVDFIEAYYEYLETNDQVVDQIAKHPSTLDIDTTVDSFIESFRKTFLANFPTTITADKRQLLKYIAEYYRGRGTEKSYELFFRILFNTDVSFYYPRTDLFRPSDGKWIQSKTLRVTQLTGDIFELQGEKIIIPSTNVTAFVERIQKIQEGPYEIFELFLNASSITGTFELGQIVQDLETGEITASIMPVITDVEILYGGVGYVPGLEIPVDSFDGFGAKLYVKEVDNELEGITKLGIRNFGAGYFSGGTVDGSLGGEILDPAIINVYTGALATYEGYFRNTDSFPSDIKYLQDGEFYQQFSYVTIVDQSLDTYRDLLLNALHPAGLKLFGRVLIEALIDARGTLSPLQPCANVLICRESIITPNHRGLESEIIAIVEPEEHAQSRPIGPTFQSLERDKFLYKPYVGYDANQDFEGTVNDGYYDTYPITPSEHFDQFHPQDIIDYPYTKINITSDSFVRTSFTLIDAGGIGSEESFGTSEITQP
jgi:hypothetical protein